MPKTVTQLLKELPEELPFLWVEFDIPGSHTHAAASPRSDGAEAAAEFLVAAIQKCDESRHNGHGRVHSAMDAHDAYYEAIRQVLTGESDEKYKELRHNMWLDDIWGGAHPEVVMLPAPNGKDWDVLVTDHVTGMPVRYSMNNDKLQSSLPHPAERGAVHGEYGWQYDKTPSVQDMLQRMKTNG